MLGLKKKIIAVVGHYGSGKTNVAVNIAFALKRSGNPVTLIDLDTVNPYFRAADAVAALNEKGIDTIIPEFANTNVDVPSLPAGINRVFDSLKDDPEGAGYFIFDVGGDDGAVALGMYRAKIETCGYDMVCVINPNRPLTASPEDTIEDLREIESWCGLRATAIVNNPALGVETTTEDVTGSIGYAKAVSELSGLPLLFTSYIPSEQVILPDSPEYFPMYSATKKLF